jgi:hypothetical protein
MEVLGRYGPLHRATQLETNPLRVWLETAFGPFPIRPKGSFERTTMAKFHTNIVILTEELLRSTMNKGCGLKRAQAKILREPFPLKSGWFERCLGKSIPEDDFKHLLKLKSEAYRIPKKRKRKNSFDRLARTDLI